MATTTPATTRNVHWDHDASELSFASPQRDVSAQSIQYVNAQLVAHGFTHGQGIRLDALPGKDQQVALKCLVNMLGQRVVDMSRTEELTTKFKTLAYDHERLVAQHTVALTTAATAERDVETGKAKMDAMYKKLASEEDAHRKSREEFQKMKNSMQYLRQTTANELKRKEKEVEKIMERLGKVSNDQVKLGTVGAGLACTNLLPDNPLPQDKHYLDAALNESEAARLALLKENDALKDTILACANALQSVRHNALSSTGNEEVQEPELILSNTFFGAANGERTQAAVSQEKLRHLFSDLRDTMSQIIGTQEAQRAARAAEQRELEELRRRVAEYESKPAVEERAESPEPTVVDQPASRPFQAALELALKEERQTTIQKRMAVSPPSPTKVKTAIFVPPRDAAPEPPTNARNKRLTDGEPALEARRPVSPVLRRKSPPTAKPVFSQPTLKSPVEMLKQAPVDKATTKPQPFVKHIIANLAASHPPPQALRPPSPLPSFLWDEDEEPQRNQPARYSPDLTADDLLMPHERDDEMLPEPAIWKTNTPPQSPPRSPQRSTDKKPAISIAIPPLFKTPTRPAFGLVPRHKYSPVVPSPLSRLALLGESLPSPPEPAQGLPPVEEELSAELREALLLAQQRAQHSEDDDDIFSDDDDEELDEDDTQETQGSGSPLTRILNLGASPALAPLVSSFAFPGLLGPAPTLNLTADLPIKRTSVKGRGDRTGAPKSRTAVLEKAENVNRPPPPPKQHVSKLSKESTSSNESASGSGSGSSGSDRNKARPSSRMSSKPKTTTTTTRPPVSRPASVARGKLSDKSDKSEKENGGSKLVPRKPTTAAPRSAMGVPRPSSRAATTASATRKVPTPVPGAAPKPSAPNRVVRRVV